MKQGWELKKLGEVCMFQNGAAHENHISDDGKYILVNSKFISSNGNIFKTTNSFLSPLYKDDIVFVMSDVPNGKALAKCFLIDKDDLYTLNQRIGVIRSDNYNKKFLYYMLNRHKYLLSFNNGKNQTNLRKNDILNCPLTLPPLSEQERIVSILDKAFSAIEQAKANAEKNLKNAKELFDSYLTSIFTNKGDGWEEKKLGEVCDFVRGPFGGSLKKNIFKSDGYVVYEQKHAIHDHFNQLRYFIDENKFSEMKRFELFPNDLIMSCSGVTLGRVAVVPDNIKKGIINQALLKLTPKKKIKVHFLKYWLRSSIFQKIIFEYSGGAAIPNVPSAKILKEILIPYPSIEEQEQFIAKIEIILAETKQLEVVYQQKLTELEDLKKSILQKAFNGELI